MTFKERLALERPNKVSDWYLGGCYGCPYQYGYEVEKLCVTNKGSLIGDCEGCWNREIPGTETMEVV